MRTSLHLAALTSALCPLSQIADGFGEWLELITQANYLLHMLNALLSGCRRPVHAFDLVPRFLPASGKVGESVCTCGAHSLGLVCVQCHS